MHPLFMISALIFMLHSNQSLPLTHLLYLVMDVLFFLGDKHTLSQ